tara:strand:+ start:1012 stop:1122 length:111 start_codon:yes stop_codon:yes gene_type:complete
MQMFAHDKKYDQYFNQSGAWMQGHWKIIGDCIHGIF